MHGMPRVTAARRISQPSERAPEPVGVLITRSTSPPAIASTTCGEPSATLRSVVHRDAHPLDRLRRAGRRDDAKAEVVQLRRETRRRPPCRLSVTVMNTVPPSGSAEPAAASAFANAVGKSVAMPITSPVERISGPSSESAP